MKKSVYSLVLMDDVVEAIDQLAYGLHTSRSNLINQILAEKVAMVTPKQHLQTVFESLSAYLKPYTHFQIQAQADDHMYSIKSALRYKYNPTIRYCIYLGQEEGRLCGWLKLISRTQSELLYYYLNEFIKLWATLESERGLVYWESEEGSKWQRRLDLSAFQEIEHGDALANCLSEYIKILDEGLKLYFSHLGNEKMQTMALKAYYNEQCKVLEPFI